MEEEESIEKKPIYEILALRDSKEWEKWVERTGEKEMCEKYKPSREKYRLFNKKLGKTKRRIEKNRKRRGRPSVNALCGGINFFMSLDEMKQKIRGELTPHIITTEEFKKIEKDYYKGARGGDYPSQDLTRIWGANYLKWAIKNKSLDEKYGVPDYVIVADDPNNIEIKLSFSKIFPCTGAKHTGISEDFGGLVGASIYFKKIEGDNLRKIPPQKVIEIKKELDDMGYVDHSEPGAESNVLLASDGKVYIVDTEKKSFTSKMYPERSWRICGKKLFRLDKDNPSSGLVIYEPTIYSYAAKKFRCQNGGNEEIKFKLLDKKKTKK